MTAVPTSQELADLDDEELAILAVSWRARAGYGDRDAFGIAHAFEVERRRRRRESQLHPLSPEPVPPRPWWKFWKTPQEGSGNGPRSPT
jgi:hypothetical protein